MTAARAPHAFLVGVVLSNLLALHKQNIILITSGYTGRSNLAPPFLPLGPKPLCLVTAPAPVPTHLRL